MLYESNFFVFVDHLKAGSMKIPRSGHSVVIFNSKLMVIAGCEPSQEASELCDITESEITNCIATASIEKYLHSQRNQVAIPVSSSDYDFCS